MNIARLFAAYRLLEKQSARERVRHRTEAFRLRAEVHEWAGKFLLKVNATPLFHNPPPVAPPPERPPVGPTEKRAALSRVPAAAEKTDEQILRAAEEAARQANGNG